MKKTLKSRIKKWKLGDYVRQFSIVAGGVLLTLWLSGRIAETSKQREVRQAMQLVILELRDNMETVQYYEQIYNEEKRIALRLQEENFSAAALPPDTIHHYSMRAFSGLGRPYHFSTDALEMLKTSGLASHIADKQQVIGILHGYTSLEQFDNMMDLYFTMRKEVLLAYDETENQAGIRSPGSEAVRFSRMIADPGIQRWIYTVPRGFDLKYFTVIQKKLEKTISQLEVAYK